jgi:uncharacterized membrane protein YdjX (TVP38/TMEM64 family)
MLLFRRGPKPRTWWLIAAGVVLAAAVVAIVVRTTGFSWSDIQYVIDELTAAMDRVHAAAMIPLMAILPVLGFPIGVVYLVAGARFGPLLGGVVVTIVTAFHLLASYGIARSFLRRPLQRFIEKRGHHLPHVPEDEAAAIALLVALVPGIPYFIRNYLPPLAGVRLRTYFWVMLPIHVARSYVAIMLGDLSADPSRRALVILVAVDALKLVVCAFVIWRLRVHHRKFHGHESHAPAPDAAS